MASLVHARVCQCHQLILESQAVHLHLFDEAPSTRGPASPRLLPLSSAIETSTTSELAAPAGNISCPASLYGGDLILLQQHMLAPEGFQHQSLEAMEHQRQKQKDQKATCCKSCGVNHAASKRNVAKLPWSRHHFTQIFQLKRSWPPSNASGHKKC